MRTVRRAVVTGAIALGALNGPHAPAPAAAWCGDAYPPYAYTLPWFEFDAAQCAVRAVGDLAAERRAGVRPLVVVPSPTLSYEYLENLEALTVSQRRVIFVSPPSRSPSSESIQELGGSVASALERIDATEGLHLLGHGLGAAVALAAAAAAATGRVRSLVLASPLGSLDDAEPGAREALAASPAPLLSTHATQGRACIDSELRALDGRASPLLAKLREGGLQPLREQRRATPPPRVPTLITRGAQDVCSESTAKGLASEMGPAKVATFAASGALAFIDEKKAFNDALLAFLDEVDKTVTRRAVPLDGIMAPY